MAATRTFDFNGNLASSTLHVAFMALQCTPRVDDQRTPDIAKQILKRMGHC